jgi:protocatechuate 3,4-dioxygenase beta subunit
VAEVTGLADAARALVHDGDSVALPLIVLPHTLSEITGPVYGHERMGTLDHDLTRQHPGEPLGERIVVTGRVLDGEGRPVRNSLVEIWQANRAGRYRHPEDTRDELPLDDGFSGFGRCPTDAVRATLIARPHDGVLRFDIHLQGERQTAFLDV